MGHLETGPTDHFEGLLASLFRGQTRTVTATMHHSGRLSCSEKTSARKDLGPWFGESLAGRSPGGAKAGAYLCAVFREIPNSLAMPPRVMPCGLACRTTCRGDCCLGVAALYSGATASPLSLAAMLRSPRTVMAPRVAGSCSWVLPKPYLPSI